MAQIQKGTTYSTGDQVTATNLNALADAAILLPGAITDQTAKTVPLAADTVLIHSAADTALRKSTLTQLFANATGIPISTGISGLGTGIATALAVNIGSAGAPVLFNGALGTPASGTVTNLTGTASININGTVGATTASTGAFTAATIKNAGSAATLRIGDAGLGGGSINSIILDYELNAASRSWRLMNDVNAFGDFVIQQSTTRAGSTYADIAAFSSTGLAVTGALSASGIVQLGTGGSSKITTIGDSTTGGDSQLRLRPNPAEYSWSLGASTLIGNAFTITPSTAVGGTTFSTPIASFTYTGLAVTGSVSSSVTGYTAMTAERTSGDGPLILLKNYSSTTYKNWYIGNSYNIGGALEFIPTTTVGGTGVGSTVVAISSSGLAVTGTLSASGAITANGGSGGYPSLTTSYQLSVGTDIVMNPTGYGIIVSGARRLVIDTTGIAVTGAITATYTYPATGQTMTSNSTATHSAMIFNNPNGAVGSINTAGSVCTFNSLSDYRRKSNVQDLTNSGTFIDALKPRTFDWDTGDKGVGFIAHEFAEVSPSSVTGEKDAVEEDGKPKYQAMQASSAEVIANLVAELQSLRQRVAALETK